MGTPTDRYRFERRMAALLRTIESMPHEGRLVIIRESKGFRWERVQARPIAPAQSQPLPAAHFPHPKPPNEQRDP